MQTYGSNKKKDFHLASSQILFHDSPEITKSTEGIIWAASNLKSSSGSGCLRKGAPVPSALPTPEEMERSLQALIQTRESFLEPIDRFLAEVQAQVFAGCFSGCSANTGLRWCHG